MKKLLLFIGIITIVILSSCTENQRAKEFGGTMYENLPDNKKLINVTWKEDHMWILTKDMNSNDIAESYNFKERSSFGLLEGTVIINESKVSLNKIILPILNLDSIIEFNKSLSH